MIHTFIVTVETYHPDDDVFTVANAANLASEIESNLCYESGQFGIDTVSVRPYDGRKWLLDGGTDDEG